MEGLKEELLITKRRIQVVWEENNILKAENINLRRKLECTNETLISKTYELVTAKSDLEDLHENLINQKRQVQTLNEDLHEIRKIIKTKDIQLKLQYHEVDSLKVEQEKLYKEGKELKEQNKALTDDIKAKDYQLDELDEQLTKWQKTCVILSKKIGDKFLLSGCNVVIGEYGRVVVTENINADKLEDITNVMLREQTSLKNQVLEMQKHLNDMILKLKQEETSTELQHFSVSRSNIQELRKTLEEMLQLKEEEREKTVIEKGVQCIRNWRGSETNFTAVTLPPDAKRLHTMVMEKQKNRLRKLSEKYDIISADGDLGANNIAKWLYRLVKSNPEDPVERLHREIRRLRIGSE